MRKMFLPAIIAIFSSLDGAAQVGYIPDSNFNKQQTFQKLLLLLPAAKENLEHSSARSIDLTKNNSSNGFTASAGYFTGTNRFEYSSTAHLAPH
jgi:hypothetical protein